MQQGGTVMNELTISQTKDDSKWKLGDIIVSYHNDIAMIVRDDDDNYCAMDITPNHRDIYSTDPAEITAGCWDSLKGFKEEFQDDWKKVDAELNIKI